MRTKYYAVVCGVTPGIYTDWPTTQRMVKGYPGAIFKSFFNKADAQEFIMRSTATAVPAEALYQPHTTPLTDKTIIYTDGSFMDGICGFGAVIITTDGDKLTAYGRVPETVIPSAPSNNIAELYAIYVALSLVKGNVILYSDSRYSISCLTTYVHNWIKTGWTGVPNAHLINGSYQLMKDRNITFLHVAAHEGFELNEAADRLADMGRKQSEDLIVLKNGTRIV